MKAYLDYICEITESEYFTFTKGSTKITKLKYIEVELYGNPRITLWEISNYRLNKLYSIFEFFDIKILEGFRFI